MDFPPDWDAWLRERGFEAGFCQSLDWAEIHAAVNGARSFALSVMEGGGRVAGMLVSLRPRPSDPLFSAASLKAVLAGQRRGSLECFEGPVLPDGDPLPSLAALLDKLDSLARSLRVRTIRLAGFAPASRWAGDEAVAGLLLRRGYQVGPWLTSLVDLRPDIENLQRALAHAARKGIRKCMDAGIVVAECQSLREFERDFRDPYYAGLAADGKEGRAPGKDAALWTVDRRRHYRFFVAKDRGGAVHAVLGTYSFNGVATEIMSGRPPAGRAGKFPAQDLLHWSAFLAHKKAGDTWFNLAGYSPAPRDAKEAGICRFKRKWGGREIAVPHFVRVTTPWPGRLGRRLVGRGR